MAAVAPAAPAAPAPSKAQKYFQSLAPISAAAASTAFVMYPVDVVRALRMASADNASLGAVQLVKNFTAIHGVTGLFRQGVFPELAKATSMRISKWFLFPVVHEAVFSRPAPQGNGFTKSIAGGLCVLPETFIIAPFELAKIALQLDSENKFKNSGTNVMRQLIAERGWKSMFIGFGPLIYRQVSFAMVLFASIGSCTQLVQPYVQSVCSPKYSKGVSTALAGFTAGVLGTMVNCFGDVIRTVQQKKALQSAATREPLTFRYFWGGVTEGVKVGMEIKQNSGWKGLYRGFGFKSLHLGGSNALMPTFIIMFSSLMGINYSGL